MKISLTEEIEQLKLFNKDKNDLLIHNIIVRLEAIVKAIEQCL